MNQLTAPALTMSSREIAVLTGKPHDNVLKLIRSLLDGGIVNSTTPQKYEHPQNKQTYIEYRCSKRDSLIIVARLSPEFTAHIVDRWQELEQQLSPVFNLPNDLPSALRALADTHEQLQQAQFEREIAIKTKAHISDKKTATAMATASNATQANQRLKDQLGQSKRNATVLAIERLTGKSYTWPPLNKWCKSHGVKPSKVHDNRYGKVNAYPAQAWKDVYNVDLVSIFGGI